MKNLLSENMMRFGTKNLSEAAKKELTLKSIMETINEHGLQKEVRRALNESMEPWQIVQAIRVAMKGMGTDDQAIYKVIVGQINKNNYPAVLAMVNEKGYKTIGDWLSTDMSKYYPNTFQMFFDPANNRITEGIVRHLQQFNQAEDIVQQRIHGTSKQTSTSVDDRTGADFVRKIVGQ